jgi:hypothetical protein
MTAIDPGAHQALRGDSWMHSGSRIIALELSFPNAVQTGGGVVDGAVRL